MNSRLAPLFIATGFVLAVSGCGSHVDRDAAAHVEADRVQHFAVADALERNYEQARAAGQWDLALTYADQLLRAEPSGVHERKMHTTLIDTRARAENARDHRQLATLWTYNAQLPGEGTTSGVVVTASVGSDNKHDESTDMQAKLVVRRHPTMGRNLYLVLEHGQFSCSPTCKVQVQFDDEPARAFVANGTTLDRRTLFIQDEQSVRDRLDQVRTVTFSTLVDGHARTLSFPVGGFDRVQFEHQVPQN